MICLRCNNQDFTEKQDAVIEQEFRGETLKVQTPAMACSKCGWTAIGLPQLDELRRRTADVYREKHGLLTSKEIKAYRYLLKMSQAVFAAFLGVGLASVKRWETWLVQERVYDDRIRAKCKEALEAQQSNNGIWICAPHHGSSKAPHGIIIHGIPPQPIAPSRWDWSSIIPPEAEDPSQLKLPISTEPIGTGTSPPLAIETHFLFQRPTARTLKKKMRTPLHREPEYFACGK